MLGGLVLGCIETDRLPLERLCSKVHRDDISNMVVVASSSGCFAKKNAMLLRKFANILSLLNVHLNNCCIFLFFNTEQARATRRQYCNAPESGLLFDGKDIPKR